MFYSTVTLITPSMASSSFADGAVCVFGHIDYCICVITLEFACQVVDVAVAVAENSRALIEYRRNVFVYDAIACARASFRTYAREVDAVLILPLSRKSLISDAAIIAQLSSDSGVDAPRWGIAIAFFISSVLSFGKSVT